MINPITFAGSIALLSLVVYAPWFLGILVISYFIAEDSMIEGEDDE